jgi:hypothetical protein
MPEKQMLKMSQNERDIFLRASFGTTKWTPEAVKLMNKNAETFRKHIEELEKMLDICDV